MSLEELRLIYEKTAELSRRASDREEELEALRRRCDNEREGLLERNGCLQRICEDLQGRVDATAQRAAELELALARNRLALDLAEERLAFYDREAERARGDSPPRLVASPPSEPAAAEEEFSEEFESVVRENEALEQRNCLLSASLEGRAAELEALREDHRRLGEEVARAQTVAANEKALRVEEREAAESAQRELDELRGVLESFRAAHCDERQTWKENAEQLDEKLKLNEQRLLQAQSELEEARARFEERARLGGASDSQADLGLSAPNQLSESGAAPRPKELQRLKLLNESLQARLDHQENALIQLTSYLYSDSSLAQYGGNPPMTEADARRIHNAKFNKSTEEMRELIHRLLLENIVLKKEKARNAEGLKQA